MELKKITKAYRPYYVIGYLQTTLENIAILIEQKDLVLKEVERALELCEEFEEANENEKEYIGISQEEI